MATLPSSTTSWDSIATAVLQSYRSTIADMTMRSTPLVSLLYGKKGSAKRTTVYKQGGRVILQPLKYGQNTTVSSMAAYDTLKVQPQEVLTMAEYGWKRFAGTLTLAGEEMDQNSGKEAFINLFSALMEQLQESMEDYLEGMLMADGTGNSGKDWLGITALVKTDPTTGTVGNIDQSVWSFWRNVTDTTTLTIPANGILGSTNDYFTKMKLKLTDKRYQPNLLLMPTDQYEAILYQVEKNYVVESQKFADIGFEVIKIRGMDILWSNRVAADTIFMMTMEFFHLYIDPQTNFRVAGPFHPTNQDVTVWHMLTRGNLISSNLRRQGKFTDFSAT